GEFEQDIDAGPQVFAFPLYVQPHVVDDHAQAGMALGDRPNLGYRERREDHNRNIVTLTVGPEPIRRAIVEKRVSTAVAKADTEAEHARLLGPCRDSILA